MIVTNLAVFHITEGGLTLSELAPGITVEQVKSATEAEFTVSLQLGSMNI